MKIRNLGTHPVFSDFEVSNPTTKRTYRVAVRGEGAGMNFCSCPDYAVNMLGTCKHIEAVLHRLRRQHSRLLKQGYRPPFAEVFVRYGAERAVMFSPGENCPAELENLARRDFDPDGRIKPEAFSRFHTFVQQAQRPGCDLRVYDDAMTLIVEVRDRQSRKTVLEQRYGGKRGTSSWNHLLKIPLYAYQRSGSLFAAIAGRVIIADEMGLGKTIQAIAAAEMLARHCGVERALVVCPTSLKSQWHHEIGQFSDRPASVIEGATHQRHALYAQNGAFFKIVNYDVVHRDLDAISSWSPDLVILDEAQRIKNWQTRTAQSVKRIASPHAMVLTGTPLENRLEELHSIVEFVDRHRLGPLFAFKAAHEIHEPDSSKVIGYRDLKRIHQTLAPILIRRTKKEVLDQLPPRMDKNFFVPMTEQQWVPHHENRDTVARLVAKWKRYRFLTEADQLRLRIALQNMRMACDSTYLIDHQTKHHTKLDELGKLLEEIFESADSKVVIFSQWVRMNELVTELLDERRWGYVHLHGGVPGKERHHLTRALREDKNCRVFLSTDAGGVGLNLQSASAVINMDLPWNPAVLEQRIGRVHRLGQRQPVRVVNFISESTIEHGMLSLLAFKRSMFAGVLDGAADQVMMGDSALNRFMKTVETATSSVPPSAPTPVEPDTSPEPEAPTEPPSTAAEPSSTTAELPQPPSQRTHTDSAAAPGEQALGELLMKGAAFLKNLGTALSGPPEPGASSRPKVGPHVQTDSATGLPELRIPLPEGQRSKQWLDVLASIAGTLS